MQDEHRRRDDETRPDDSREPRLTRRALLGGAVGAAALTALPDLLVAPRPALAAPMIGTRGLVGSTIFGGGGLTRIQASNQFDRFLQRPACLNVQRVYYGVGQWPVDAQSQQALVDLAQNGIKMLVSFKPDGISSAEHTNLTNAMHFLNGLVGLYGAVFEVALWHEGNHDFQRFPTAADYQNLVAHYAPVVQGAGFPLVYIPLMATGNAIAYDPGPSVCDRISVDYYSDAYYVKDIGLDTISAYADQSGRPLGMGEWGLTGSSAFTPSQAQFRAFAQYVQAFMAMRLQAGLTNGDVIWFDGGGGDDLTSSTDWKVPVLQSIYDALNR